jgi:hypothetical protein
MSEVRPWHEARISLARFELTQAAVLVDCSQKCPKDLTNREAWNWYSIGEAFSRPVSSSDDVSDYAPTQILAEAFRQRWYDGIIYNSGLNTDGKNVALFNLSHADVKERFLYTLSDVAYFFYKHGTGESEPPATATPEAPKPKRKLSAAGRKAIIAATKKRWRLQNAAAKAAAKKAASKKAAVRKVVAKKAAAKKTAPAAAQAVTGER